MSDDTFGCQMTEPNLTANPTANLVLASGSPRRSELLAGLGLDFTIRPVDLDESPLAAEAPRAYVARLARDKAVARCEVDEWVLAADTIVVLDGELLGKPRDAEQAASMLGALSGRRHEVLTGVALARRQSDGDIDIGLRVESTQVQIAGLDPDFITWYVATGEPLDKAGSYAAQGIGAVFVRELRGSYSNVIGLPLHAVFDLCREMSIDLFSFRARPSLPL